MKERLITLTLVLIFCSSSVVSQTFLDDLETVRKIKLLEAYPDDVAKILAKNDLGLYKLYKEKPFYGASLTASHVRLEYSSGKCLEEPDSDFMSQDDWDVLKSKVTGIEISPWDDIELKDIGVNITKFHKERPYRSYKNLHVLLDKDAGIAFEIHGTLIKHVYLFPSRNNLSLLCKNESLRKFYLGNKWRLVPEEKHTIVDFNYPAHVTDLQVTKLEGEDKKFQVQVTAKDPENDVLYYNYNVSDGKINGMGAKVIWDLSSAGPGTYTITAGVDDGCGICGRIMSKVVTIK